MDNKLKEEEFDIIFKVIIIGDSNVGKSNLMRRYLNQEFSKETKATIGVEFGSKHLEIEGYAVKIQIWDTAGNERYKSIATTYYQNSKGVLVVYDITRLDSFNNVNKWVNEVRQYGNKDVQIILIGNKCDLEEKRQVDSNLGVEKAKDLGKSCS